MVERHECPLPVLVNPRDKVKESGDPWICNDPVDGCQRSWVVGWVRGWAWNTQPQWFCLTPPNAPALAARTVQPRQSLVPVVALALNATLDVTATWDTPFPDGNYVWDALPLGALLGKVTVTEKSRTAAAVVLTVKATAATLVAANLNVIGVRWG